MSRLIALFTLFALANTLSFSGETADAAPPTIVAVSQVLGHLSVESRLPDGVIYPMVEVATAPAVNSDGTFLAKNLVIDASGIPSSLDWVGSQQLSPGTYYVHVYSVDDASAVCDSQGICE